MSESQKDLCEMSFDDLVDAMTWDAMQSIVKGKPLRGIVYLICDLAIRWRGEQDKKKAREGK